MGFSYNQVTIGGNLTRDIEVRYSKDGTAVANMDIAINNKYKDKETTVFMQVTAFGAQGENAAKWLKKGDPVLIGGRLNQDNWEDKETGAKRSKITVIADRVQFLPNIGGEGRGGDNDDRRSSREGHGDNQRSRGRDDDRGGPRGRRDDDGGSRSSRRDPQDDPDWRV